MVTAQAPYNFVRLPKGVVASDEIPDGDRYHADLLTGEIELRIETKTPFFIGGTGSRSDAEKPVPFFEIDGRPAIPGSSLRGMISTLFEIVTWSKLRFVDDDLLFYRKVPVGNRGGGNDTLGDKYLAELSDAKVSAGWIFRDGSAFKIRPSKKVEGRTFFRVPYTQATNVLGHERKWDRKRVWFKASGDSDRVTAIEAARPNEAGFHEGWLIRPGSLNVRTRAGERFTATNWIVTLPEDKPSEMTLDPEVIEHYRTEIGGITREIQNNNFAVLPGTLAQFARDKDSLPAFFIERKEKDGRDLVIFGHTRYFRVPYERRMSAALPPEHASDALDLAEAVFGYVGGKGRGSRRGRVSFEDATLEGAPTWEVAQAESVAELYSPRPTSYQLYLQQPATWNRQLPRAIVTWNDLDAKIRGTKLFWHRAGADWRHRLPHAPRSSKIQPLAAGNEFCARIRFENLAPHEIGALLTVIDLDDGLCHKLGVGKPLGLGSVRVHVKSLKISDRSGRYKAILDGSQFAVSHETANGRIPEMKQDFARWLVQRLPDDDLKELPERADALARLWQHPRMAELNALLTFRDSPDWLRRTAYAGFKEHHPGIVLRRAVAYARDEDETPAAGSTLAGRASSPRPQRQPAGDRVAPRRPEPRSDDGGASIEDAQRAKQPVRDKERPSLKMNSTYDGVIVEITSNTILAECAGQRVEIPQSTVGGFAPPKKGDLRRVKIVGIESGRIEGRLLLR